MPRGKETERVGGQIDPYVQRSIQQSKQLAESRLVAAMQETGATARTGMQEAGATERAGIQAGTRRMGIAAQAASDDKRAAEDEKARREDLEYRKINDDANRKLQKAITDQNVKLREAEMAQDVEMAEKAVELQLDFATIDVAHKMREGKASRNMMHSMFKTFAGQEEIKQKNITNYVNAKNETLQVENIHSQAVIDVANRLQDDPRMQMDISEKGFKSIEQMREERSNPFAAIQDQIALKQSKVALEDCFPDNIHRIEKQLSEEDLTMMDIRTTWSVMKGAISTLDERVKESEEEDNKFQADFYRSRRLRLNNSLISLQGLMNSATPVKNQANITVGSRVRDALSPILGLNMGSDVKKMIESGIDINDIYDRFSESMEEYAPLDVSGLRTKQGQSFLTGINSLLMNQGEIE